MPETYADVLRRLVSGPDSVRSSPALRQAAVDESLRQYPTLDTLGPIALTVGSGPFQSETYLPDDPHNPLPGSLDVQLRSKESMSDPSVLPETVASEGLHGLYNQDPIYQAFTHQFVKTMTPEQIAEAKKRYQGLGEDEPFEHWLPRVQAQEHIRGFLFPKVDDKSGEWAAQYTPGQRKLLSILKDYVSQTSQKPLKGKANGSGR